MYSLTHDLRYSFRQIRNFPGFSAVVVITLALAIGGNTAIFSLINAVMLRTLPVKDPGRLVLLKWKAKSIPKTKSSASYANCPPVRGSTLGAGDVFSDVPLEPDGCSFSLPFFEQIQNDRSVLSDVAAFVPADLTVNAEGRTSRARGLFVSGEFFSTLGVRAAAGRLLDGRDDSEGATPSIVISHRFWQSELSGDRAVLGKEILIGKILFTIVGVTTPGSAQLDPGVACDLWVPLAFRSKVPPSPPKGTAATAIWLELIGRLKPKTSSAQAASALSVEFAASSTSGPEAIFKPDAAPQVELASAAHGLATLRRNFSKALFALLAAVALVLLISCVNIAGLMLARSAARRKELATRVALGASRGRIVSQLLTESLWLSLAGGAVGMALGVTGARILVSFFSRNWSMPLQLEVHPDARVFAFTFLVSVAVGISFGLIPALSSGRPNLVSALKGESGGATETGRHPAFGSLIVITQIALAMPILAGAGLVTHTLANLKGENIGFEPQHLLVFRLDSTYTQKNPGSLYKDLQQQLSSLPGVASVSYSGVAVLSNEGMSAPIFSHDQPELQVRAHGLPMSSDFLKTMGIPLRKGQIFDDDSEHPPGKDAPTQVVVNETLVQQLFGSRDPIGKYFNLGSPSGPSFEIIGVVGDAKYGEVREPIRPTVYMPVGSWNGPIYFEVRTGMAPAAVITEIDSAVRRYDRNLLIVGMKTETEQIDEDLYQERLMSVLSGLLAALAVTVACIGIYGLLAFQVARRTQEIGIRLALGAGREDVLRLVLGRGTRLAVAGTLIGCAAALAVTHYLQSFLFEVKPSDPLTFLSMAVLLVGIALIGSYIPARRAAKVDPMVALRYE